MSYIVYILHFSDNGLYIGQTNNLSGRIKERAAKNAKAAKFSKDHGDFVLVYQEMFASQVEAMMREKQLKGWTRAKKEALIKKNYKLLKDL